jgi:hypothetical protein
MCENPNLELLTLRELWCLHAKRRYICDLTELNPKLRASNKNFIWKFLTKEWHDGPKQAFFFKLKGPEADATEAPQPGRLIVQPCDEDEVFFLLFHFNVYHKSHMDWPEI